LDWHGAGFGQAATRPHHSKGMTVEAFDNLKRMLAEIEDDMAKAEGGNKAAGVRVRKIMQDVKDIAQEIRIKILEKSKTEEKA
jgi:hypothetical protein